MSSATMQGLVYRGPRERTQIEEVAVPTPEAGQVLMKVGAVGVCGTDIHVWQGDNHQMPGPRILGHEFSGVIAAIGAGVTEFTVGERVVSETASWVCGICPYCRAGQYNVCPNRKGFGFGADGAMANYVISRPGILHRIPAHVQMSHASLTEPGCVAYNAIIEKSRPRPADHVVVMGPGPIGLMCIAVLRLAGVARISVVGLRRDGNRLELAKQMGADDVLVSDEQDVVSAVLNAGDGFGAHLVVDAVGVSKTLDQSLDMVRPNGQITKIGWGPAPVGFSIDRLVAKAATLQGSFSHLHGTWERILELMGTGQINVAPLVTEFDLLDWHEGFMAMEELAIPKAVLRPNGNVE